MDKKMWNSVLIIAIGNPGVVRSKERLAYGLANINDNLVPNY